MNAIHNNKWMWLIAILLLSVSIFLGACANLNPLDSQSPSPTPPPKEQAPSQVQTPTTPQDVKVIYNYGDTGTVQLSANNIILTVGQRLILAPAPGLTKTTHFTSSGDYYFGNIMQQASGQENGQVTFVAQNPGKGKLQIIPNSTETERAVDLWVTVQ